MKLKWIILIALFGGLILGPLISNVPGSTYILLDQTAIEFKNNFAIALVLLSLVGVWLLWILIRYLLKTSNLTVGWFGDRNLRKARQQTIDGMIALAEGHWKTAENLLVKGAKFRDTKLINYLAAARAAQEQDDHKSRDEYLQAAAKAQPDAHIAIGLTQAQLKIRHRQYEQALATLNHLRELSPHHPYVLKLLHQLYTKLGDWERIIELLPKLHKNRVYSAERVADIEVIAWAELLSLIAKRDGLTAVNEQWLKLSKNVRKRPEAQLAYAEILAEQHQYDQLELHIKDSMKQQWQERLAQLYGMIESQEPSRTLATAETWLKQKPNNAVLLTTLGKLSLRAQLWGKAKKYLEQSIEQQATAEAYYYLGQAYKELGHPIQAQEVFYTGLANEVSPQKKHEVIEDLSEE
ncbi:heme biosynthesis HemY N-terminal domain-containing protein [Kangiella spongicola]|uniref:Heme biosynthesis protein HemY n=1 Tax=Kangiella spongicola TaxID=796379 RepID=A0A318DAG4_9GAMM|nr:heme biosynthesis HemY N-terminal domain-containing protein [Kangiella spongicola]PXF64234.1 heme biosynthesis protein HemY [Kangiella spongicola]